VRGSVRGYVSQEHAFPGQNAHQEHQAREVCGNDDDVAFHETVDGPQRDACRQNGEHLERQVAGTVAYTVLRLYARTFEAGNFSLRREIAALCDVRAPP
jgi:hypothetical protein